jgi:hypothetical protein
VEHHLVQRQVLGAGLLAGVIHHPARGQQHAVGVVPPEAAFLPVAQQVLAPFVADDDYVDVPLEEVFTPTCGVGPVFAQNLFRERAGCVDSIDAG